MRERWIDNGQGLLSIDTETMHIHIRRKEKKNTTYIVALIILKLFLLL